MGPGPAMDAERLALFEVGEILVWAGLGIMCLFSILIPPRSANHGGIALPRPTLAGG